MRPIVIVGASLAGLRAAQALRLAGHGGDIVVIGAEERMPYTRPPLSKELLAGTYEPEQCDFDCSAVDVTWRLGERAVRLDPHRAQLVVQGGETVDYSRIILATGSRARKWLGLGNDLPGLITLRDLDDAIALRDALADHPRLVVVGAGFVGCEVAATARKLGLEVAVVDLAPHPMVPLGPTLGERWSELHTGNGVELHLGMGLAGFLGDQRVEAVELVDGSRLPADLAVVALGAAPNTEWLDGSGLTFNRGGVVCGETLTARGFEDVLCAGDIATWPHPLAAGELVRVEHWTNAAEQGAAVGRNALLDLRERRDFASLPYFWTDQYGLRIQSVGLHARASETRLVEGSPRGTPAMYAGFARGRMVSAVAINAARRLATYRPLVKAGALAAEVLEAARAHERSPAALA